MSTDATTQAEPNGLGHAQMGGPSIVQFRRHSKFYFEDTLLVIQVENMLFKVHKYLLLESETFSDMFKVPQGMKGQPREGSSPEYPIMLNGVKSSDFEALLTILYTRHFSESRPLPIATLIIPAFRLAHMWNFANVRTHLMPIVETVVHGVDKIVLARELDVQEWLVPAYLDLCQRPEPLTVEEATKLGVHSIVMISRLREEFRPLKSLPSPSQNDLYCSNCIGFSYHQSHSQQNSPVVWGVKSKSNSSCTNCGKSINDHFCRNTGSVQAIASKLKKWVKGGCITE